MTRHELRYKTMTILYQAFLYDSNNIEYDVENIISEQLEESNKFVSQLSLAAKAQQEPVSCWSFIDVTYPSSTKE